MNIIAARVLEPGYFKKSTIVRSNFFPDVAGQISTSYNEIIGLNRRKEVGDCMNPRHDEQIEEIRNNLLASRKILNAMCEENRQKHLSAYLQRRQYAKYLEEF